MAIRAYRHSSSKSKAAFSLRALSSVHAAVLDVARNVNKLLSVARPHLTRANTNWRHILVKDLQ